MISGPVTIAAFKRSLVDELSGLFPGNEASSVARIILEHAGFTEYSILKDPSAIIDNKIRHEIKKIVGELHHNKPVQYILGETEFMNLRFFVNEHVLIPRPETEEMVTHIIRENRLDAPRIIDLGSGSGCIAVSLAHHIPGSRVTALEVDGEAIKVAEKNADAHRIKMHFVHQSIFDFHTVGGEDLYDIIVSNPPYVTMKQKTRMAENVTRFEPHVALFVPDNDPLVFYREIARIALHCLAENGAVWVEINEELGEDTSRLFRASGFKHVLLIEDIHGKIRFIKVMKEHG